MLPSPEIPTLRTDAHQESMVAGYNDWPVFARTLERELNQAKEEIERLKLKQWDPEKDPEMVFSDDYGWLHKSQADIFKNQSEEIEKYRNHCASNACSAHQIPEPLTCPICDGMNRYEAWKDKADAQSAQLDEMWGLLNDYNSHPDFTDAEFWREVQQLKLKYNR